MKGVDTIARVRREFFVRGRSLKEISRDLHVSRNTVRKIVRSGATAFEYERRVQPRPKIGPLQDELDSLLSANAARSARELHARALGLRTWEHRARALRLWRSERSLDQQVDERRRSALWGLRHRPRHRQAVGGGGAHGRREGERPLTRAVS